MKEPIADNEPAQAIISNNLCIANPPFLGAGFNRLPFPYDVRNFIIYDLSELVNKYFLY